MWLGERAFDSQRVVMAQLPLDVADSLAYAILLAALDRATQSREPWVEGLEVDRLQGLAAFGAHLVALRNEIERAQRRRIQRGRGGLCSQLRAGSGLFQLWRAVLDPERPFLTDSFQGSLPTPGQPSRGDVLEVSPAEKRLVVDRLLEISWVGQPHVDLASSYCG